MKAINTSCWKAVKVSDFFEVVQETADNQAQKLVEGHIPLVSAGKTRNGIAKRIENPVEGSTLFPEFCITIDMFGKAFLQTERFYAVSHARINILIPKDERLKNKKVGLFFAAILSKKFEQISSYNSMCGKSRIEKDRFYLPLCDNGEPDWEFIEDFMNKTLDECRLRISHLSDLNKLPLNQVQTKNWKPFRLGGENGIFKIHKGTRLTKANMVNGNYPFVGASAKCNGITKYVGNRENLIPGNKITINYNGSIGESFWQDKDFLASDDVNWCEPNVDKFPDFCLNRYIALFLCALTKKIGQKYHYINKWTKSNMEKEMITLPVNDDGKPDWEYIESYMRALELQCGAKIRTVKSLL